MIEANKQKWQSLYCAVVYDSEHNDSIVFAWATYADHIRQAEEIFDEEFGPLMDKYRVLFRLVKEGEAIDR